MHNERPDPGNFAGNFILLIDFVSVCRYVGCLVLFAAIVELLCEALYRLIERRVGIYWVL